MDQRVTRLTLLSPDAALLIRSDKEKVMVISDLHIGWEVSLAEKGVHVPSQTPRLLEKIKRIAASEHPDRLVVLGDVKHAIAKIATEEWREVPRFLEEASEIVPRV